MNRAAIIALSLTFAGQALAFEDDGRIGLKNLPASLIHGRDGYILKVRNPDTTPKSCSISVHYSGQSVLDNFKIIFHARQGRGIHLTKLNDLALRAESLANVDNPYWAPGFDDLEIYSNCTRVSAIESLKYLPKLSTEECENNAQAASCFRICRASDATVKTCYGERLTGH
jgi:hypothetical protein